MLRRVREDISMSVGLVWSVSMGLMKIFLDPIKNYVQGGQFRTRRYVQLEGKVAVITGGEAALEIAVDLARREAKVIIGMKNAAAGAERLLEAIEDRTGSTNVYVRELNLASFDSVHDFVEEFDEERLDILINCAETMESGTSPDGIEWTMQENFYGHFLLTILFLDLLRESAPSRIVIKSSKLHTYAWEFWKRSWFNIVNVLPHSGYLKSMHANAIFTQILAKNLRNTGVLVNSYHDGYTAEKVLPSALLRKLNPTVQEHLFKTPRSAAQTAIRLAADPELRASGKLFSDCQREIETVDLSEDFDAIEFIWDKSYDLVGMNLVNNEQDRQDSSEDNLNRSL